MLTISCNLLNAVLEVKKENYCVGKSGHRLYRICHTIGGWWGAVTSWESISPCVIAWGKDQNKILKKYVFYWMYIVFLPL